MNDSLKFGLPYGLAAFGLLLLHAEWGEGFQAWWRWIIVHGVGMTSLIYAARQRNRAYFPFRFGFLFGFNTLFVATMLEGALMFLFSERIVGEVPKGITETKWTLYLIFIESMGFMFVGLLTTAFTSFIFRTKKP